MHRDKKEKCQSMITGITSQTLFTLLTSRKKSKINLDLLTEKQIDFYKERLAFILCDIKAKLGSVDKEKAQEIAFRLALREEKSY